MTTAHQTMLLLASVLLASRPALAQVPTPDGKAGPREALVSRALSAAPPAVGSGAAVVDMKDDGKMTTIREGGNGWTCLPHDPGTPTGDPVCVDRAGLAWFQAVMAGKEPDPALVGYSYMLKGGSVWSATDPRATKLPDGEKTFVKIPPHVMILNARLAGQSGFPSGQAHPDARRPFVLYGGTPCAILIIPVPPGD